MVLARAVPNPASPRAILLREGVRLEQPVIHKLGEMKVRELWIRFPGLEELAECVNEEFEEACRDVCANLSATFRSTVGRSDADIDFGSYRRAVVGMLESLVSNPKAAVFLDALRAGECPQADRAGAVCALSLLVGLQLESYVVRERGRLSGAAAKDLSALGVGALFHDVGMTRLKPEVAARWESTRDEADAEWREHVTLGFDMVKASLEPAGAAVVLHHHQRWDGGGFPAIPNISGKPTPLRGRQIHIFARIVGGAELFERLRAGGRVPVVRVLRMLREPACAGRLDPLVMTALALAAPPYPPGTLVGLSDGRLAAVVARSAGNPCRPVVEVIENLVPTRRMPCRGERIDLSRTPNLSIVEAEGVDVREDNFEPRTEREFDLRWTTREMSTGGRDAAA
jgi:hypothetical protein